MTDHSTPRIKSERERRREHAERTARWRERTRHRPEPRVVDRAVLEAILVAVEDPSVVPPAVAAAIIRSVTGSAALGLQRLGYSERASLYGIGKRLAALHGRGPTSVVKSALDDAAMGLPPQKRRRPA